MYDNGTVDDNLKTYMPLKGDSDSHRYFNKLLYCNKTNQDLKKAFTKLKNYEAGNFFMIDSHKLVAGQNYNNNPNSNRHNDYDP